MNRVHIIIAALAAAAVVALILIFTDPACEDTSKEPVGARHPVECGK